MSSPLLKGSVLLSQQKGSVEEAPNDGWAYARVFDGSDYVWDKTPSFDSIGVDNTTPTEPTHGITITDHGNSSMRIEDATRAKIAWTSGGAGTQMGAVGFNNAGDTYLEASLGNMELVSSGNVTYRSGILQDHIWQYNGTTTEAMRIDGSNGRLGINTSAPDQLLHVHNGVIRASRSSAQWLDIRNNDSGGSRFENFFDDAAAKYTIFNHATDTSTAITSGTHGYQLLLVDPTDGTTQRHGYLMQMFQSGSSQHGFYSGTSGTTSEQVRIASDGGFHLKEKSAKGTAITAMGQLWVKNEVPNTLWYVADDGTNQRISTVEGTFTPTIQDTSFSDAEGQTYNTQNGYYWIHGGLCFFWVDIGINSLGTLTVGDAAYIANLPFAATYGNYTISFNYGSSLNITAGYQPVGRILSGQTHAILQQFGGTAGTGNMTIGNLSAGGRLIGTGFYRIAYTS